jgi:hypothetical protein
MADMRETLDMSWTEHRRTVDRFAAFSALDDDAKASWLAWCMAKTLEASMGIDKKAGQSGPEPIDLHDHLAKLMAINVASHWRPTSANYFDRASKQTLLAHVSEVGGPDHGGKLHGFEEGRSLGVVREAVRLAYHRRPPKSRKPRSLGCPRRCGSAPSPRATLRTSSPSKLGANPRRRARSMNWRPAKIRKPTQPSLVDA